MTHRNALPSEDQAWLEERLDPSHSASCYEQLQEPPTTVGAEIMMFLRQNGGDSHSQLASIIRNLWRLWTILQASSLVLPRPTPDQMRVYLNTKHWQASDGGPGLPMSEKTRDTAISVLIGFFAYHLRRLHVDEPDDEAVRIVLVPGIQALPGCKKRTKRLPFSLEFRPRLLRAINDLPMTDVESLQYRVYFRQKLKAGPRDPEITTVVWGGGESRDGRRRSLQPEEGKANKTRSDLTVDDLGDRELTALRALSKFPDDSNVILYDLKEAQRNRCVPWSGRTQSRAYAILRKKAKIPATVEFNANGLRAAARTREVIEGQSATAVASNSNHERESTINIKHYLNPLTQFEAAELMSNLIGHRISTVCQRCGILVEPQQRVCPRRSCAQALYGQQRGEARRVLSLEAFAHLARIGDSA
ncbi:MAG: hypothetical protein ACYC2H_01105 [Thermoplasmatota archaeon]